MRAVPDGAGRVGLVWWEDFDLYFTIVDPAGARLIPDVFLATAVFGGFQPVADVHWDGTEFGVVWNQDYDELDFQRIAADGTPIGTPIDVAAGWGSSPSLTLTGARVSHAGSGVGWAVLSANTFSSQLYFQRVPTSGPLPLPVPFGLGVGLPDYDLAGAPDGRFAVVYQAGMQKISAAGALDGPLVPVSATEVIEHDGQTWVSMTRRHTTISGVSHTQLLLTRGETLATSTVAFDTTSTMTPEAWRLSVLGDEYAFTFQVPTTPPGMNRNLRLGRLRGPGTPTGAASLLVPPALSFAMDTADGYSAPAVAWTGADSVLTFWSDVRWGQLELYEMASTFPACM